MTRATFEQKTHEFYDRWDNEYVEVYSPEYKNQCMDLFNKFLLEVTGTPRIISLYAKDVFRLAGDEWEKIPYSAGMIPILGDVVVWNGNIGGGAGHIAMARDAWASNTNTFDVFGQNWPTGSKAHYQRHNYSNVIGWLRLKTQEPVVPLPPAPDPRDQQIVDLIGQVKTLTDEAARLDGVIVERNIEISVLKAKVDALEKNEETLHDEIDIRDTEIKTLRSEIEKLHKIWDGHVCETRELSIHDHIQALYEYIKQLLKRK